MGKSTHFTGQPVYSQVIKLLNKTKIKELSRQTAGSEAYVKRFDGYTHLIVMLFGVLKHFDSLRELEIGMKAEVNKLCHLGIDYVVRRSTLAEANKRRSQEFFAKVYADLLEQYTPFLADSRVKGEEKNWERALYMMDSTTISLFDNILKGVGRHPKSGKKKGGMKVHTVMKYQVGVPMVVQLTSAAKHDHYLLKEVHLPKDSTLTMDRAYIDYAQFQRLTDEGICYVTKMKSNLKYKVHLHFFYGDSINAIQIQTWIVLIANLLCTVISRKIKRKVSFSQIVTMIRLTLMYYTDFISFMENPESDEMKILAERVNSPPQFPTLFD